MKRLLLVLSVLLWVASGSVCVAAQGFDSLDESEQKAMADTFQYALENNPTDLDSTWVNPDAAHSGKVKPVKTFYNSQGEPCREFTQTIIIGNQEEQGYGTACRQPDGSWQIVSDQSSQSAVSRVEPAENRTIIYITETPWPTYYRSSYGVPYPYWYPYYYPSNFTFSFNYIYHSGNSYKRSRIHPRYNYYRPHKSRPGHDRYRIEAPRRDRHDRHIWKEKLRHKKNPKKQHRRK
jgi:surface antigen